MTTNSMLTNAMEACNDTYNKTSQLPQGSNLKYIDTVDPTDPVTGKSNGFKANIYQNTETGKYIVAFNGSDDINDWTGSDADMLRGKIPEQFGNAKEMLENLSRPDGSRISMSDVEMLTGHSLGGSLAQLLGQLDDYKNIPVVTLNPLGTEGLNGGILDGLDKSNDNSNISNYVLPDDLIPGMKGQVGNVTLLTPSIMQLLYPTISKFLFRPLSVTSCLGYIVYSVNAHVSILNNAYLSFADALSASMPVDPLIVDLDGDGIETTTKENGVFFDHKNDGFSELTAWVGKDDGILVHDKNNNGVIDNGSELLGDNTFAA